MGNPRLLIEGLCKSYASPVLTNVNLSINPGEIHAIVGENGAGKSTLVNILTGIVDPEDGKISLDGESYSPSSPKQAFLAGVSVATQELATVGTMSVAENIGLKSLPARRGVVDTDALCDLAKASMDLVGLDAVNPRIRAEQLSLADQQLVELAKAMHGDSRLLILDEPTAALTAPQADRLHTLVREAAKRGTAVIYVSHRLKDVLDVADNVSVLRDGHVVLSNAARSLTIDALVHAMAGQAFDQNRPAETSRDIGAPAIRAESLTAAHLPEAIDFEAYPGEIVGLSGLAGAGRSELLHALYGITPPTSGRVVRICNGDETAVRNARQAIELGIAMLGEDRKSSGLFEGQSITVNTMIPGKQASGLALIDRENEAHSTRALIDKVDIRCENETQDISQLSGGNQQKALLARWLHRDSEIYLLDEPTRGVDVATKTAIYGLLRDLAADGKCIVVASSENEELLALCDRIVVMSKRRIADTFNASGCSEEDLLRAAFSAFTDDTGRLEEYPR